MFSFATVVNVGSAQEVPGITGLAHMFEHMAFKGTPEIGTTDWPAEKEALAQAGGGLPGLPARAPRRAPRPGQARHAQQGVRGAAEGGQQYVKPNEFDHILEQDGAIGINAFTTADETGYFYSLPANKTELFAYLESGRFLHPVFREFYKERSVVQEERRLRIESNPIGKLVEQFTTTAFMAHPYRYPTVGYMSDLAVDHDHRRQEVLQHLLHAVEHGHGDRRRRPRRDAHPAPREVLRPHPEAPRPAAAAHRRADPDRREERGDPRSDPAVLHRGLPQAGDHRPGPGGLRRHRRHHDQRPDLAPLPPPGARRQARRPGRSRSPASRATSTPTSGRCSPSPHPG